MPPNNKGFALFYAVLLSSVVLVVSLGLFNITYRQLIISSTLLDSQTAYYVADSLLACARYEKLKLTTAGNKSLDCVGSSSHQITIVNNSDIFTGYIDDDVSLGEERCFDLQSSYNGTARTYSFLVSGYNLSCSNLAANPRAVERTIRSE